MAGIAALEFLLWHDTGLSSLVFILAILLGGLTGGLWRVVRGLHRFRKQILDSRT
jgi:ABC-type uncharacterized transport system permease subunit